jgi:hypothetical protein
MKELLGKLSLFVISLIVSLGLGEALIRQVVTPAPKYEEILRRLVYHPERLFDPNISVRYNIRGLYEGANTVDLNVSKNRLIEPEPEGPHKFRVLFLGGSTTEAIYVPQDERWVARLNERGYIATYNGAQSGANTIDEYNTFKYLTGQGMKFDLVILSSGQNDISWTQTFEKYGHPFIVEQYREGISDYYRAEVAPNQEPNDHWLENSATYLVVSEAIERARAALRPKPVAAADSSPRVTVMSNSEVTQTYLEMRVKAMKTFSNSKRPAGVSLMDLYPHLKDLKEKYRAYEAHNLRLMNEAVARTGAKLLVMTEASSWMAAGSSFYQDLRIPAGFLSFQDFYEFNVLMSDALLDAAREVGALTYDLAGEVNPHSNGPEGGRYMYDNMHYTPEGCRLAASFIRPVLHRLLETGSLESHRPARETPAVDSAATSVPPRR